MKANQSMEVFSFSLIVYVFYHVLKYVLYFPGKGIPYCLLALLFLLSFVLQFLLFSYVTSVGSASYVFNGYRTFAEYVRIHDK